MQLQSSKINEMFLNKTRFQSFNMTPVQSSTRSSRKLLAHYDTAFRADRDGLTEMMLQQFNTPLLAFREVVQNSRDEGASRIEVTIQEMPQENYVSVSVNDDGRGMDLERVRRYLTLFDSTKEGVLRTVGEMGVGKIFVFALKPDYVVLETGTDSEGYKVVINRDMSGKLMTGAPRRGTRVTTLIPRDASKRPKLMAAIRESIIKNCGYISTPLIINGEPVNRPFAIDSPYKVTFEDGDTRGIVALTGKEGYALLKGGITLETGNQSLMTGNHRADRQLNGLELLVDSYHFNQPLSRNAVNRDEEFQRIVQQMATAAQQLMNDVIEVYKTLGTVSVVKELISEAVGIDIPLPHLRSPEARMIRDYLRKQLLGLSWDYGPKSECVVPQELRAVPLLRTANGEFISVEDVAAQAIKHKDKRVYLSDKQRNAQELLYFTERKIPVLNENEYRIGPVLHKRYGIKCVPLEDNLVIPSLVEGLKLRYGSEQQQFLDTLMSIVGNIQRETTTAIQRGVTRGLSSGSNGYGTQGTLGSYVQTAGGYYDGNGTPKPNKPSYFNWDQIKLLAFDDFRTFKGKPRSDLILKWVNEKGAVILNSNHPYVKLYNLIFSLHF